jgi:catechol 2,3-dioxygenase
MRIAPHLGQGEEMTAKVRLGHVGVVVKNPKHSAEFYCDLLGMDVTMEGTFSGLGDFVFLSERPREELQTLALATNPRAAHFAMEVESLGALKAIHADAQARGVPIFIALNHKVSLSLYLQDPDGNAVEVYWSTGQRVDRPYGVPVDLGKPEAELLDLINQPMPI